MARVAGCIRRAGECAPGALPVPCLPGLTRDGRDMVSPALQSTGDAPNQLRAQNLCLMTNASRPTPAFHIIVTLLANLALTHHDKNSFAG